MEEKPWDARELGTGSRAGGWLPNNEASNIQGNSMEQDERMGEDGMENEGSSVKHRRSALELSEWFGVRNDLEITVRTA